MKLKKYLWALPILFFLTPMSMIGYEVFQNNTNKTISELDCMQSELLLKTANKVRALEEDVEFLRSMVILSSQYGPEK